MLSSVTFLLLLCHNLVGILAWSTSLTSSISNQRRNTVRNIRSFAYPQDVAKKTVLQASQKSIDASSSKPKHSSSPSPSSLSSTYYQHDPTALFNLDIARVATWGPHLPSTNNNNNNNNNNNLTSAILATSTCTLSTTNAKQAADKANEMLRHMEELHASGSRTVKPNMHSYLLVLKSYNRLAQKYLSSAQSGKPSESRGNGKSMNKNKSKNKQLWKVRQKMIHVWETVQELHERMLASVHQEAAEEEGWLEYHEALLECFSAVSRLAPIVPQMLDKEGPETMYVAEHAEVILNSTISRANKCHETDSGAQKTLILACFSHVIQAWTYTALDKNKVNPSSHNDGKNGGEEEVKRTIMVPQDRAAQVLERMLLFFENSQEQQGTPCQKEVKTQELLLQASFEHVIQSFAAHISPFDCQNDSLQEFFQQDLNLEVPPQFPKVSSLHEDEPACFPTVFQTTHRDDQVSLGHALHWLQRMHQYEYNNGCKDKDWPMLVQPRAYVPVVLALLGAHSHSTSYNKKNKTNKQFKVGKTWGGAIRLAEFLLFKYAVPLYMQRKYPHQVPGKDTSDVTIDASLFPEVVDSATDFTHQQTSEQDKNDNEEGIHRCLNAFLHALGMLSPQDARALLTHMQAWEKESLYPALQPSTISYNTVLWSWARRASSCAQGRRQLSSSGGGDEEDAMYAAQQCDLLLRLWLKKKQKPRVVPDGHSYGAVMEAWSKLAALPCTDVEHRGAMAAERVEDWLDEMQSKYDAFDSLDEGKKESCHMPPKPTLLHYTASIHAWSKQSRPRARKRNRRNGGKPRTGMLDTSNSYSNYDVWVPSVEAAKRAQFVLERLEQSYRDEFLPAEWEGEASFLSLSQRVSEDEEKWRSMRPDAVCYTSVIHAWANVAGATSASGHPGKVEVNAIEQAELVLSRMEQLCFDEDVSFRHTEDGALDHVDRSMHKPNERTYAAVLRVMAESRPQVQGSSLVGRANRIVQNMHPPPQTIYVYNHLLNVCANALSSTRSDMYPPNNDGKGDGSNWGEEWKEAWMVVMQTYQMLLSSSKTPQPDSFTHAFFLKALHNAMQPSPDEKRIKLAVHAFKRCCQDGCVSQEVWFRFQQVVNEGEGGAGRVVQSFVHRYLMGVHNTDMNHNHWRLHDEEAKVEVTVNDLPKKWTRNVLMR